MLEKREIIERERAEFVRIFKYTLGGEEVLKNFHIFLIDCRGEKDLKDVIKRIDQLMENDAIKEKEIIQFPMVFQKPLRELAQEEDLKNIDPVVNELYKFNFITGSRKVESHLVPGYYHYLDWVGIILSIGINNMELIPGVLEHKFNKVQDFMEATVPADAMKFTQKINAIQADDDIKELQQFFGIAKKVRPELAQEFKNVELQIYRNSQRITQDINDYLDAMESTSEMEIKEK